MRYTLLDLTQKILSSMDSDEVNSINDTTESRAVVDVIQTTYYDIVSRGELPRHFTMFNLVPSNDLDVPTVMTLPTNVCDLHWVKYDIATLDHPEMTMAEVKPMPLMEFLEMVLSLNVNDPNVFSYQYTTINGNTINLQGNNHTGPRWYTTYDDNTLIFDSYNTDMDNTLQGTKTLCWGQKTVPWNNTDTFIPDLDEKQHQLLLNEAKAMCFAELKQVAHPKAEKNARNLWINQQSAKTKVPLQTAYQKGGPYYGRK